MTWLAIRIVELFGYCVRRLLLKRISQSTRPKKISDNLFDFQTVKELYELYEVIEPVLKVLELSPWYQSVHYKFLIISMG